LEPVVVVLGASGEDVRAAIREEDVIVIDNPLWHEGQSTSVRAGLAAAADGVEGVVFLLSDMPLVGPDLLGALVRKHRDTLAPIVVPQVGGRRTNPVLFDRVTFPDLLELRGDVGGRALFKRFSIETVDWGEDIFLDIDTEEDLRRLEALE
jgi:molybdenum cofactor cytidylyltransferase